MTSGSETATGLGDYQEEECPLCLGPLPPFWYVERQAVATCCGKCICLDCKHKKAAYLQRALASGSFGREERQLNSYCAVCRTRYPTTHDGASRGMIDKFEKGQLPLTLYRELALTYLSGMGSVEMNVERGMEIMMLGANEGDPSCQYYIDGKYSCGEDGVPKSTTEAKRWLLAAADQGHARAEHLLALVFLEDEGNDPEYLRYLRGAASKGYDDACHDLGLAHYEGSHGAKRSAEEAIRVLMPAAERGHAGSMRVLGTLLCDPYPLGSPRDNPNFSKGVHWLRRAAEKGDRYAITNLTATEEVIGKRCFMCDKNAPPDKSFLRCSRCRAAWYCSKDCQVQHWRAEGGHKQCCIKWESS